MTRPSLDQLLLSVSVVALGLFYGGAPLSLALPGGVLVWCVGRNRLVFSSGLGALLAVLLALYPLYIALIQLSYWRSGQQGVDFGIFSQLIHQVAQSNRFITSLISTDWRNFITHHFSPFLIVLGLMAKFGISSESMLIGAHVVAVALLLVGLRTLWVLGGTSVYALVLTATALVLPGVRRGIGWETHDEVLALPFIVWSLVAHVSGRNALRLLLLFPPLLFKETFGLVMLLTGLAYAFDSRVGAGGDDRVAKKRSLQVALFGGFFFVLVTQVFPRVLWSPTFDPSARISSLNELLDSGMLWQKARWLVVVFTPAIPFLFLHTRNSLRVSAVLIAPALYNIGAILITNFPGMLNPYNYYSITPAIIAFVALSYPVARHSRFASMMLCAVALAVMCGTTVRSSKIVRAGLAEPSAYAELRALVPKDARVIADDYTASVLADNSQVMRLFHAQLVSAPFDYLIVRRTHSDPLPESITKGTQVCHETARYIIRCPVR